MSVRRSVAYAGLTFSVLALAFSMGSWFTHRAIAQQLADQDARVAELRDDMARDILQIREAQRGPSGTAGQNGADAVPATGDSQSAFVDEIKRQIQSEMGLFPVRLLRDRGESFVELNAVDSNGKTSYGTAGYLGNGYFITVKHGVMALDDSPEGRDARRIEDIRIR